MLRILSRYLRPYWLQVTILVIFQVAQACLNLYLPNLQADIINNGVAAGDQDKIYQIGWEMIGVAGLQIVAQVAAVIISARIAMRLGYEVRRDFFGSVESFSLSEMEKFSAGSLVTRVTNDVQQVQQTTYQTLLIILQAPVMFIGGLIMAVQQDGPLTWSLAIILPVIVIIALVLMSRMGPLFAKLQDRLDSLNRIVREQIAGVRVIRAFTREKTEEKRFDVANTSMYKVLVSVGRLMSMMIPLIFFMVNMSNLAIMWFGGKRIDAGEMQIGSLQAFIQYLMIILMGIMMAAMMSVMLPRASVSAKRITKVLDTESDIKAPEHPYWQGTPAGKLEFKDVSFRYPGAEEPILSHISFTAQPGQTTAFIGSTGSGKSSLLRLAMRMFDVTEGQVLLDGHDLREYDPDQLATVFGPVPQKAMLFSGTIRSNLRYGKQDATEEEMWEALRVAQADDFVREIPEGLDAPVAQGGTNFSGGQKQRLCMARAIIRQPRVYSFDDSFSALDMATDRKLRAALKPVTTEATVLLVAQRAASIRDADQILVLDSGRIVGRGTHDELMQTCETYKEIVDSQGGQGPDVEDLSIDEKGGR
ncbi:MAG: ABC transporter ATP-binding protein/permease [Bifidobacteriaceae bacterium]|jgi:ATP-binding cassette subfamily B protein|nr:ABC transporter ATP-binding protein/permease [Bifidobacteriaceae bacterium]MCI1979290.1 ABC transporter ATP-binding protein/permease [Bifidobacteriaceae bacterium]